MIDLLGYGAFFLTTALIFALISLGLNLQWGLTGLFNVGVAGFVAIGAYTSALLTTPDDAARFGGFDLPIVVGWLGAMLVAGIAAAITGFATLRLEIGLSGDHHLRRRRRRPTRGAERAELHRRRLRRRLHPAALRARLPRRRSISTSPISPSWRP